MRKRLLFGISCSILTTLAGLALLLPQVLWAIPACSVLWDYYEDNTFQTMIGGKSVDCGGSTGIWGSTSCYYEFAVIASCSTNRCRNEGEWFRCENGIVTEATGEYNVGGTCPCP